MTQVTKLWPLLTATHRYDKSISTWQRGHGTQIEAPILAYLIETKHGRILYDVGCFPMGAPQMSEEQRLPAHFARLGLTPADIDLVFLSHLHFDHAGGLCEVCGAEVHVHAAELQAAKAKADDAYFVDDFTGDYRWKLQTDEYDLVPGVRAINTPGHTAGHMSLLIELPQGRPVILAGDAADLVENIDQEIAPGSLWQGREVLAIESIRKLKALAKETDGDLWPNHDMAFWRGLKQFPEFHS
jgi:N-acyl homoserine lactone hydrolase